MTQNDPARPRLFGALIESFERDEQERHHPNLMSLAGPVVFLVVVLGPLMFWNLPVRLAAYFMMVVACICAFWWLDRGFAIRIGYGVSLLGSLSVIAYINQLRSPGTQVGEPLRIKWFVVLVTVSFVIAVVRRMRRDRENPPTRG